MNHPIDFQNKTALITGGTSGLGRALAIALSARGARVAVLARRTEGLVRLKAELPQLHIIQGDVSDKRSIHRIYFEAIAGLGDIDILVNNASALGTTPMPTLLETSCEDLAQVLETNLIGPFRLTKLCLAPMLLKGEGLVLNISSDAGREAYPNWGAYGVSKAALDHLTKVFAAELGAQGITFLSLDPGDMDTPMHAAALPDADPGAIRAPKESARLILDALANGRVSAVVGRV